MCGYEVYDEKGQCTYTISVRLQKIIDRNDALMEMFAPTDYRYNGYLWNKLFKASIIKENNLSFVNMRRELSNIDVSQILLNAHAAAMYYSVGRYYSMCHQFNELSVCEIKEVEKRLLLGVGFCKYVHFRYENLKRRIKKICKNS